jgi:hypothetical protein
MKMLPALPSRRNRWVAVPCCTVPSKQLVNALRLAEQRERVARLPATKRTWWWLNWRAVQTVRELFF